MKYKQVVRKILPIAAVLGLMGCGHDDLRKNVLEENEKSSESIYRVAKSMHDLGDYGTAIRMYRQAISMNPGSVPALTGLGRAARETGQVADTILLLEKALRNNPGSIPLKVEMGKLYIVASQGEKAEKHLKEVLLSQSNPDILNAMGVALDLQNKHEEARSFYKKALEEDPGHAGVLSNMGLSLALDYKYKESMLTLESLLARDNPSPRDRQNLALVYALSGNHEKAKRMYEKDLDTDAMQRNMALIQKLSSRLKDKQTEITSSSGKKPD